MMLAAEGKTALINQFSQNVLPAMHINKDSMKLNPDPCLRKKCGAPIGAQAVRELICTNSKISIIRANCSNPTLS